MFFGKKKLRVRSEEDEDRVKTFIEYYGLKQKDEFKVKVLSELIGNDLCMVVVDSRLLYSGNQGRPQVTFREIIEYLDSAKILYKKIEIKKIPEVTMFGVTIKKGSEKTDKDYIVGFTLNRDNLKKIEGVVSKFNTYYFIDKSGQEEVLLKKLENNYEYVDEMSKEFYCQIFDNNFTDQLVILSGCESATEIKEIINSCYSD
ncbi:hypothetical protein [Clostridium sp.]|uniref:hypothetical protein n=1 Tax=Clostridium sp. TaxID=1506 RepID=UPI0026178E24|nr:hypothetical protein [Clostridium sp.]